MVSRQCSRRAGTITGTGSQRRPCQAKPDDRPDRYPRPDRPGRRRRTQSGDAILPIATRKDQARFAAGDLGGSLGGVILLAAIGFAIVSALATRWFVVFVLLAAAFLYLSWMRAAGNTEADVRFRRRARDLGLWIWAAFLGLVGLAIFWRFSQWWSASLFGIVYLAIGIWNIRWLSRRATESYVQFRQAVALTVLPILFAWFLNSTLFQVYAGLASRARLQHFDDQGWVSRLDARSDRLAASELPVAVTLSGGGYRAAAVHADSGRNSRTSTTSAPSKYLCSVLRRRWSAGATVVMKPYSMPCPNWIR